MSDCIFCKIIRKELSANIIDENEHVIVIEDISPKAPVHYLVIPKLHIENMNAVEDTQEHYTALKEMWKMIRKLSSELAEPKSFSLVSNNGKESGQCVFHMHWHFLSGRNIHRV